MEQILIFVQFGLFILHSRIITEEKEVKWLNN